MCLGDDTSTKTTNTTTNQSQLQTPTANPVVAGAAQSNVDYLNSLRNAGYQPYTGQRVADFSDLQNKGFAAANDPTMQDWINQFSTTANPTMSTESIASNMDPYMSKYVEQALAPQLALQKNQFDDQRKTVDAGATSSGAYGDPRAAIEQDKLRQSQDAARSGLIGNAYNTAFNTAIGAGAQDVANKNTAQQTNIASFIQQLQRMGQGVGLDQNMINFLQQMGGLQQQQQQAELNVPYSDKLAADQFKLLMAQLGNQTGATTAAMLPPSVHTSGTGTSNGTTVQSTPDNSGFALGGSILGGLASNPATWATLMAI